MRWCRRSAFILWQASSGMAGRGFSIPCSLSDSAGIRLQALRIASNCFPSRLQGGQIHWWILILRRSQKVSGWSIPSDINRECSLQFIIQRAMVATSYFGSLSQLISRQLLSCMRARYSITQLLDSVMSSSWQICSVPISSNSRSMKISARRSGSLDMHL